MNNILSNVRKSLKEISTEELALGAKRYFKEEIKVYGLKSATVSQIAKSHFPRQKSKAEIYSLCEELFSSGYMEESFIACDWSHFVKKDYSIDDIELFQKWLKSYVSNWATCDTFCNHTVGDFLINFPQKITVLKTWAKSQNRWVRRGAAVSLIIPARRGLFLADIFEIASILLGDQDDMVQKGYGWMLKAASQAHQEEVYTFVMTNKAKMPRAALRYAIEKMPPELRSQAMTK